MKNLATPHVLLLLGGVFFAWSISAQSLAPTVISSTGGFSENADGSLSYTVGEMTMVETFTGGNNILTQGFQQPNDIPTGILDLTKNDAGSFIVYPNPAVDHLWFGFEFAVAGKADVAVYNVLGQKMAEAFHGDYQNGKTVETLNVTDYAAGNYLMTLTFTPNNGSKAQRITQRFQVIK